MLGDNSDNAWAKFGESDAYHNVASSDDFKDANLTAENKAKFFASGENHIKEVMRNVKQHIDQNFIPVKAMDFGCGVGRMIIPLSKIAEDVLGVDVSEAMIGHAKSNCQERSIENARFLKADDDLATLDEKFNFIHSFIVLQHIPVKRGVRVFRNMLRLLEDDGVCVLHFTFAKSREKISRKDKVKQFIKKYFPLAQVMVNLARRGEVVSPKMQMNPYDLNKLFLMIQEAGIKEVYSQYVVHGAYTGICMYFQKRGLE